MAVVSTGKAVFEVPSTGEIISIDATSLNWEWVDGDEGPMGARFAYEAACEVEAKNGEQFDITWTVHEYPSGSIETTDVEHGGLNMKQDITCDVQEGPDEN